MASDDRGKLSPEDLDKAIEMLRAGNRQTTIAKYFGVSSVAFFNRRARDPDFGLRWSRADAEGEIAAWRALEAAAKDGKPTGPYQWILEHRYGWTSPINKARIEELRARTAASKAMSSPDSAKAYREIVADLLNRRPGVAPVVPAEPEAKEGSDANP